MKKLQNLKGAKALNKKEQQSINGGAPLDPDRDGNCPFNECWIGGPECPQGQVCNPVGPAWPDCNVCIGENQ